MKVKLELKNKAIVSDLHELKEFLKQSSKNFKTNINDASKWAKHNYKEDKLSQRLKECTTSQAAIYCINDHLQTNLMRKLNLSSKKINEEPNKTIIAQPRENILSKLKEVYNFEK